jgi:hypothetical protein
VRWLFPALVLAGLGCAQAADMIGDAPGFPDASHGDTSAYAYDAAPRADALEAADAEVPDAAPCVGGNAAAVDPASQHCYLLFTNGERWTDAETACHALGAHLASIASAGENTFVDTLISDRTVWLGASDTTTEGSWLWNTGETVVFTNWDSGQPDNGSGSEDCALMRGSGRWNDDQCGSDHGYVCERD